MNYQAPLRGKNPDMFELLPSLKVSLRLYLYIVLGLLPPAYTKNRGGRSKLDICIRINSKKACSACYIWRLYQVFNVYLTALYWSLGRQIHTTERSALPAHALTANRRRYGCKRHSATKPHWLPCFCCCPCVGAFFAVL